MGQNISLKNILAETIDSGQKDSWEPHSEQEESKTELNKDLIWEARQRESNVLANEMSYLRAD